MLENIKRHNEQIRQNILKGFNSDLTDSIEENSLFNKGEIEYDELQKAVYADTAENRKLGRVGQEYKRSKGKKESHSQRLAYLKGKGMMELTDEEFKEYNQLVEKVGGKEKAKKIEPRYSQKKTKKEDGNYPSRQEEKEIRKMMQENGLNPDEQSEKTWRKYQKKLKS